MNYQRVDLTAPCNMIYNISLRKVHFVAH